MSGDEVTEGTVLATRIGHVDRSKEHEARQAALPADKRESDPSAPAAVHARLAAKDEAARTQRDLADER